MTPGDGATVSISSGAISGSLSLAVRDTEPEQPRYVLLSSGALRMSIPVTSTTASFQSGGSITLTIPIARDVQSGKAGYVRARFRGVDGEFWAPVTSVTNHRAVLELPSGSMTEFKTVLNLDTLDATFDVEEFTGSQASPIRSSFPDSWSLRSAGAIATDCPPFPGNPNLPDYSPCGGRLVPLAPALPGGSNSHIGIVLVHGWLREVANGEDYYREQKMMCAPDYADGSCAAWSTPDPPDRSRALPGRAYFRELISALEPQLSSQFGGAPLYVFDYQSYLSYVESGQQLRDELKREKAATNLDGFILVGHSMGGLLSRVAAQALEAEEHDAQTVRGIITLATPHEGTPLPSYYVASVFSGIRTEGTQSLLLPLPRDERAPLVMYGGDINNGLEDHGVGYEGGWILLCNAGMCSNDGAVPVSSALPPSFSSAGASVLRGVFADYDHSELKLDRGKTFRGGELFDSISLDLSRLLNRAGATDLEFKVPPTTAIVGSPLAPVEVVVLDGKGMPILAPDYTISIRIGNNAAGAVLSGSTRVATHNGVATFADLWVDRAGDGFTLIASAVAGLSASSTAFDVIGKSPAPAPNPPTLTAPGTVGAPGPTLGTLAPTFTWSAVSGATGYGLYIRDLTTNTLVYPPGGTVLTPLTGTSFVLPGGVLVNDHQYRWAMTSFNGPTQSTAQSPYLFFVAPAGAPPPPLSPPSIDGLAPASYPASNSNQTMTINGAHFQAGATLTFSPAHGGPIPSTAAKLTYNSSGQLVYLFNNMSDVGTWSVTVNNPDGQSSSAWQFNVAAAPSQSDLVVQSLGVTPGSGPPGSSVTLSLTIKNQGSGTASASTANLRLSTSASTVTTSDLLVAQLGVPAITAGGAFSVDEAVTIPVGTPPGMHYVWAILDVNSVANQSDFANDKANTAFTVTAACGPPIAVSASVMGSSTWSPGAPGCVHYLVTGSIVVSGSLAILPGTVVAFGANASLTVTTGSLNAVGTASQHIRFQGAQAVRGYWAGLTFWSNSATNELTYVEVAHGGWCAPCGGSNPDNANVRVISGARLRLMHSTLEESSGFGLYVGTGVSLPGFAANAFRNNADAGVRLPDEQVGALDIASDYTTGDGTNYIDVYGWGIAGTVTWRVTAVPIRFTGTTGITGALTLTPGMTILFGPYAGWTVTSGSLNAVGTASQHIRFQGEQAVRGYWTGLTFWSNSTANELTYVEVAHGGWCAPCGGSNPDNANVRVISGARLRLTNSTLRDSDGWGLYVDAFSAVTPTPVASAGNAFVNNLLGGSNVP